MERRRFLLTGASALVAGASLRAEVPEWEKPLFDLRKVSSSPVRVKSIDVLQNGKNYFVRALSADGATGITIAKDPIEVLLPILKHKVAPAFIGKDARDLESLIDDVYVKNYKLAGQALWLPVSCVEQALLDMLGRTAKKPVGQILGGQLRKEIPVYLSGSARELTAEQEVDIYVRGVEATGAKAVKFKIGGRMSRNADAYPGRTEKLLTLARKRLGDNIILYADANGSYDAKKAIEMGRMLQDLKFQFFEEPCPWEEVSETKKVADTLDIPIAFGEQNSSLWAFDWMMSTGVMEIAQPDLNYNGGFIRALRVARIARKHKGVITPHNTQTGAAGAKVLQFASCCPNPGPYMEYPWREPEKPASWYSPNLFIRNGKIAVPDGPGLGIDYDPACIAAAKPI
ncbi:MAG: mandelate racemase/muconate lactonizing enzyme family protein [Bryobacteraceae bacterium]|nr:mandelate racemase/muconate lactonizing enzyme family protein [Bryobacteraceae bacterium]